MTEQTHRPRWPLVVIGGSAFVAVWSGWVGLGELTGFGVIKPLPGIWDGLEVNTAITLPAGMEAYATYALYVATDPRRMPDRVRRFAWLSAGGALLLGAAGQVAYHLMKAAGVTQAPWQVVAFVACLPVMVLGAAALLWHLVSGAELVPMARERKWSPVKSSGMRVKSTPAPTDTTTAVESPRPVLSLAAQSAEPAARSAGTVDGWALARQYVADHDALPERAWLIGQGVAPRTATRIRQKLSEEAA